MIDADHESSGHGTKSSCAEKSKLFLRLFLQNERRLYAYILTLLHNRTDADDVLQETSLVDVGQVRPGKPTGRLRGLGLPGRVLQNPQSEQADSSGVEFSSARNYSSGSPKPRWSRSTRSNWKSAVQHWQAACRNSGRAIASCSFGGSPTAPRHNRPRKLPAGLSKPCTRRSRNCDKFSSIASSERSPRRADREPRFTDPRRVAGASRRPVRRDNHAAHNATARRTHPQTSGSRSLLRPVHEFLRRSDPSVCRPHPTGRGYRLAGKSRSRSPNRRAHRVRLQALRLQKRQGDSQAGAKRSSRRMRFLLWGAIGLSGLAAGLCCSV